MTFSITVNLGWLLAAGVFVVLAPVIAYFEGYIRGRAPLIEDLCECERKRQELLLREIVRQ